MRTNVVLIDFENVQPSSLDRLAGEQYRVIVFVGATQAKLPFDVVAAVQRMGSRAEYVKISGTGPNALDFHIAFHIGQIAAQDPSAFFHVISKDTGFDPLIRHLKSRSIFAARSATIESMPSAKITPKRVAQERARAFADALRQPQSTRPRTGKTLARHIATHFQKLHLAEAEVEALVTALQTEGYLSIVDDKVAYSLD